MTRLPEIGRQIELFGVGCRGCGSFRGTFEVRAVRQGPKPRLVVKARAVRCAGAGGAEVLAELALDWDGGLESWRASCGGDEVIVNIAGHYQGPRLVA